MKFIVLSALLIQSACGPSKCDSYVKAFCAKAALCLSLNQAQCERDTNKLLESLHYDEDICEKGEKGVLAMTCAEFRAEFFSN